jgi:hypothetical protein
LQYLCSKAPFALNPSETPLVVAASQILVAVASQTLVVAASQTLVVAASQTLVAVASLLQAGVNQPLALLDNLAALQAKPAILRTYVYGEIKQQVCVSYKTGCLPLGKIFNASYYP